MSNIGAAVHVNQSNVYYFLRSCSSMFFAIAYRLPKNKQKTSAIPTLSMLQSLTSLMLNTYVNTVLHTAQSNSI